MSGKEDRRFFRINDSIGINYRQLSRNELANLKESDIYNELPAIDVLSDLDNQIELLVSRMKIKFPDMAELGSVLNQKIQYIVNHSNLGDELSRIAEYTLKQVDMSACGIAFYSNKKLELDSWLDIELVLKPSNQYVKLLGRTVSCEKSTTSHSDGDYLLRLNFDEIGGEVQEYLIQYIVKRQGALLQASRMGKENPAEPS